MKQASSGLWFGQTPDFAASKVAPVIETDNGAEASEEDDVAPDRPADAISNDRTPVGKQSSRNAIFVGHGKNKIPLQQLEKFLSEYKIPHKVAIDEPPPGQNQPEWGTHFTTSRNNHH